MSSLKKWRQWLGDSSMPIYCVPGLFDYLQVAARPYVEEWSEREDATIHDLSGAVARIGPCRMPASEFLLADGQLGYLVAVADTDDGGQDVTMTALVDFGLMTSPIKATVHALPSGRVYKASFTGDIKLITNQERANDIRALWVRCATTALVFSQVFRRHRTRIECVSTGNPRTGTASYRGDVYVVRGFSDVLKHYRKLDEQEAVRTAGKQRWHMRAGHFVLLNTPREYWRNPCEAGDERLGRIVKDYSLPKYQPRERTA